MHLEIAHALETFKLPRSPRSHHPDDHPLFPVLGALDGSLIPQKKPSAAQARSDADAYWSYKGHVARLLLAICDANGLFLYMNAGSPRTTGNDG
jgi:hypothetical protein